MCGAGVENDEELAYALIRFSTGPVLSRLLTPTRLRLSLACRSGRRRPIALGTMREEEKAPNDTATDRIRSFCSTPSETVLSLDGLGLEQLPEDGIELLRESRACERLERLNLAHNDLSSLPEFLSVECPRLRILFCLGNRFDTIPACLSKSESLSMLSFKSCNLHGTIFGASLPPNLRWLILTDNKIEALGDDFGTRAGGVRKLMLANNRISKLPENFMAGGLASSLELLRLSNNDLAEFPNCLFQGEKLAWLALGGNPCTRTTVKTVSNLDQEARVDLGEYSLEETPSLGSGASGDVYEATRSGCGEKKFAVKMYKGSVTSDGSVLDEMNAALDLRHVPGLIPVLGFFEGTTSGSASTTFGIVMEKIPDMQALGGTPSFSSVTRDVYKAQLFDSFDDGFRIAVRIAETMKHVHDAGYTHGDLYGHNILFAATPPHGCYLTDLGAAYPCKDPRTELLEVLAYGYLLEELLSAAKPSATDAPLREAATRLMSKCVSALRSRPTFAQIVDFLNSVAGSSGC